MRRVSFRIDFQSIQLLRGQIIGAFPLEKARHQMDAAKGLLKVVRCSISKAIELNIRRLQGSVRALNFGRPIDDDLHNRLTKRGDGPLVILAPRLTTASDALLPQSERGAWHQSDLPVGFADFHGLFRVARPVDDFDLLRPEPQQHILLG